MKIFAILLGYYFFPTILYAQEKEAVLSSEQASQLENEAASISTDIEDDSYWQTLEHLRKHPLNLNTASENELRELHMLTELQVVNMVRYRDLFGKLVSIYELQAVPLWDIKTIKSLLSFVKIDSNEATIENFGKRFQKGAKTILLRTSRVMERSKGYEKPAVASTQHYLGSPSKIFLRYTYNFKGLFQYGICGEKDGGEQFFKGKERGGFDFYSAQFFAKKLGIIQSLAIGDFTVCLGQGLIQWQGFAFKKTAMVMDIKREGTVLHPYSGPGEYNFHRGVGITLQKRKWSATWFYSLRKLDANLAFDSSNVPFISSLETSGYHRTTNEINDRNDLRCVTYGGNIQVGNSYWHFGMNVIQYAFSFPFRPSGKPYDIFSLDGDHLCNYSIDYSYTFKNAHAFGEIAPGKNNDLAMVHGLLLSLDHNTDLSILYRRISKQYQSLFSNAFTETAAPVNESGLYAGISLRPAMSWQLNAFADIFHFPWLKYLVNAPGYGSNYMLQLTYIPNKEIECLSRLEFNNKPVNSNKTDLIITPVINIRQQNWRTQIDFHISRSLSMQSRTELLWLDKGINLKERGYSGYFGVNFKPSRKLISGNIRLQYFETDSYDSRIYVFEDDPLYSFSIPALFGRGFRYYLNLAFNGTKFLRVIQVRKSSFKAWLKIARSVYPGVSGIGSGLDEINKDHKTELKLQLMMEFL